MTEAHLPAVLRRCFCWLTALTQPAPHPEEVPPPLSPQSIPEPDARGSDNGDGFECCTLAPATAGFQLGPREGEG